MAKPTHFDGIAHKFNNNIYGSLKGQLRHAILSQLLQEKLVDKEKLKILDVGGGTGVMSKQCALWGHSVDLLEPSAEILDIARGELSDITNIAFFHASLYEYEPSEMYDLVICHAVLEWLAEPTSALLALKRFLKPDGLLSLSVFNKDAARFANMLYGNFAYVENDLQAKKQVRLNPTNPIYPRELLAALSEENWQVDKVSGIRCFSDYMKRNISDDEFDTLLKLELQYCDQEPFLWLGKYFHVFASPARQTEA